MTDITRPDINADIALTQLVLFLAALVLVKMEYGFSTSMTSVPSGIQEHRVVNGGPSGTRGVQIPLDCGVYPATTFAVVFSFYERMEINLIDGAGNKVFHLNPRLDQNHTVLNSKIGGSWGPEQIPGGMPFVAGDKYQVLCVYESSGYRIFVNGDEFAFYAHRSPVVPVMFEIEEANVFLASYSQGGPRWAMQTMSSSYKVNDFGPMGVEVPYQHPLQQPFSVGSAVTVVGFINNGADRIIINLLGYDNTIVFHFNPRFGESDVVRNVLTHSQNWGAEETDGGLPLVPGKKFSVSFVCEPAGFQTYVNGEKFVFFNHRLDFNTIHAVKADKDMKLFKITQC